MSCLPNNKLSFITNNVKGVQSLKKRLKLIQYFKSRVGPCRLLFLQETHSNSKVEQKWEEDIHGKVFFSHGKTNFCFIYFCLFSELLTLELKNLPLKTTNRSQQPYFNSQCLHQQF